MYCWGNNDEGQVGDLTFASRNVPTITEPSVEDPSVPWEEVQSGVNHTCARKGWYVYCFGSNSRGQLALGDYDSRNKPTQVTLSGILSVGSYHTCLIKSSAVNDTVLCAGANDYAQLGASTPMDSPVFLGPKAPTSFPTWQYVEAGGRHTCAGYLNNLYCWGSNDSGQLGNPTSSAVGPTPQAISYYLYGFNWVSVIAGDSHTCAIQEPDKLFCWGANDAGQLGIGSNQQKADAVEIGVGWKSVSLGFSHSCGIKNDATLWCWGDNTEGQIGTGTGSVNFPTQIQ
jgi:alpha-tubulin suppressor-like RCC1 family protein